MMLGCGRVGDYVGSPLLTIINDLIFFLDNNRLTIRAYWSPNGTSPSQFVTYQDGLLLERGSSSGKNFTPATAGVVPKLACISIAPNVSLTAYYPLGGPAVQPKLANLTTLKYRSQHRLRGRYRIADNSLNRYELYQGIDAQPDFTQAAWQTFTSLPFTTPALAVSHTYNFVLRKRNVHNLLSQNIAAWSITLDAAGAPSNPPTAPSMQSIAQAAGGAARILAKYDYPLDAAGVVADTWAVWLTSNGVDPNPAVDVPAYTIAMILADGVAALDWTSGTFTQGATLKAIVRTRRSGTPNVDSTNAAIMQTTANAVGPLAPANAQVFLGQSARQI